MLSKVRHFIHKRTLKSIYHVIFESHLFYFCLVWVQNIHSIKIFYKKNLYGQCAFWIVMHIQPLFLRIQTLSNFLIKLLLKIVFLLRINSSEAYQHLSPSLQIHIHITQDGLI